jgi:hypothetical protein
MHFLYNAVAVAVAVILAAICLPEMCWFLYERYFGKFHIKSKLKLHGTCKIGVIKGYLLTPRFGIPGNICPYDFYREAYRELGLAHAEKQDVEELAGKPLEGFATMSFLTIVHERDGLKVAILHVEHQAPHKIYWSDTIPPLSKFDMMLAIDAAHAISDLPKSSSDPQLLQAAA